MALDLPGEHELVGAVDLEVDEGVDATGAVEDVGELAVGDGDAQRLRSQPVDDRGDLARLAQPSSGTLAVASTALGNQRDFIHGALQPPGLLRERPDYRSR